MAIAEVEAARDELQSKRAKASHRHKEALFALTAIRLPTSTTGLAARLQLPSWALDLLIATLGSIGANGLGASLLAFGAHGKRQTVPEVIEATAIEAVPDHAAPPINLKEHAAKFGISCLVPATGQQTQLQSIFEAYVQWCRSMSIEPLPSRDIGTELSALFGKAGIEIDSFENQHVALNIAIRPKVRELSAVN